MQFEPRTLQVLKNFNSINPNLGFKKGSVIKTISPNRTIIAKATVPESFPQDFAIYDLSKFLSVLSLFDKPELKFHEKFLQIVRDKNKVNYTFADSDHVKHAPEKDLKLPSVDVEFTMTPEMFSSVTKAMSVLGLPEIVIEGKNGVLSLQARDSKNPSGDLYAVEVGETSKTFTVIFKAENLKLLPGSYEVQVSSKGFSYFKGAGIDYWVAIESSSKFE